MTTQPTVPYGEWASPITPQAVVAAAASPGEVRVTPSAVFWHESRPEEGGRIQLVRKPDAPAGSDPQDLLPEGWSARTRVHEYGGAAWFPTEDAVWFCRWDDQRIHRLPLGPDGAAGDPIPVTPEPETKHGLRYADLQVHGDLLVCVRERHDGVAPGDDAVNEIVSLPADGSAEPVVLVTGPDFVAAPRISPDGTQLAWIQWNHPDMPWDSTELLVADLSADGRSIGEPTVVAGGPGESVIQPLWRADGVLHFISDRTDWWNVYRRDAGGSVVAVTELEAEVGTPAWVFGMTRYGFLGDGRTVIAYASDGLDRLAIVDDDGAVVDVDTPYSELASLATRDGRVAFVGAGFTQEAVVVEIAFGDDGPGEAKILRPSRELGLDDSWFSVATPVSFASGPNGERTAHALYYPPTNPEVRGPEGEAPPLLVMIHGGPTGMARGRLDLAKQYWTSRGFALVDVNYGGSTGYGRPYRELLKDNWGVVDVEDCIAAARHLADQGLADPHRLCIRGGSAGGFTVLAAMVQSDVFAAGACSYGVADLTALAEETHKFESRYLDGLIGPYPEAKAIYDERSPIQHVDQLNDPLIVFQGLEDEIVPPNQSEMIVDALKAKGVPVEYHAFEGEQHGFRKSETVIEVLESELAFYGQVLGFTPAS